MEAAAAVSGAGTGGGGGGGGGVHSRIPAECFATETYDCAADPAHMCCAYM